MAIPHAKSGEPVDVRPLGPQLASSRTATLVKTEHLEIIRLVIPAGKNIAEHRVAGELTVQCLEGRVTFKSGETQRELSPGMLLFLNGGEPHSLRAIEDSSVLVTIVLR
jgi:quercetin dioxygenase-like cupin family protein